MNFFYQSRVESFSSFLSDDNTYPAHLHRQVELMYVVSGSLDIIVEGETYHLKQNDISLTFPDKIHSLYATILCRIVLLKQRVVKKKSPPPSKSIVDQYFCKIQLCSLWLLQQISTNWVSWINRIAFSGSSRDQMSETKMLVRIYFFGSFTGGWVLAPSSFL